MTKAQNQKHVSNLFRISSFEFRISPGGFTLLEAVVALALIVAAAIGPLTLASRGIFEAKFSRSKIIALNLAQEGIELIRHMRESNVLAGRHWRGLQGSCRAGCTRLADGSYQPDVYTAPTGSTPPLSTDAPLRFDASQALYAQSFGTETPYRRVITISTPAADQMRVESVVSWEELGLSRQIRLEEVFYNWE